MPVKEGLLWAAEAVCCPDKHPISKMLFCFADRLVVSGRKHAGLPRTEADWCDLGAKEKKHTHSLCSLSRTQLETWGKQKAWKAHRPSSHSQMCHYQAVSKTCGRCVFIGVCRESPQQGSRKMDHWFEDLCPVPFHSFLAEAFPGSSPCSVPSLTSPYSYSLKCSMD